MNNRAIAFEDAATPEEGRYDPDDYECPACGGGLMRIRRRTVDRLLSTITPVHRFRCTMLECGFEGILRAHTVNRRPQRPASNDDAAA